VLCCNRCNNLKGCATIEEFLNTLETMAAAVRAFVLTESAGEPGHGTRCDPEESRLVLP
jgi:hypothetical protein